MRRVEIITGVFVFCVMCGLLARAIWNSRLKAERLGCQNNLRAIGLGLANYCETKGTFPSGTIHNARLPPEDRLSWLVSIVPYVESHAFDPIDQSQGWDSQHNMRILKGAFAPFLCPNDPAKEDVNGLGLTNYIGIAGVGSDAASFGKENANAGVFGYDRQTSLKDVTDGYSTTFMVAETSLENGPWAAGGSPTVRGLEVDGMPYLGQNGQFRAAHTRISFPVGSSHLTQVLFVDFSVRSFSNRLDPKLFEAMATIAGGEKVDQLRGED